MKNIAIFASGSGSNFEAIARQINDGNIKCNLSLLVVNKKNAYVIERAKKYNVETLVLTLKEMKTKEAYEEVIVKRLKELNIDYIFLAGYMLYCGKVLLDNYEGRIINIHPALLPAFKGANGILDAYNYGVKVYGVTVHFVDSGIDSGKIIDQEAFYDEGYSFEEIEAKIHAIEHSLYPRVVKRFVEGEYEQ